MYFWRSCISGEVDCLEDAKGCFIYWSVKSIKISSHKDSPQTVEPSHHSMSTLYKPQVVLIYIITFIQDNLFF
ncbi:hypothetical protein HanXRQr2_Chr10g0457451 [Helianthus annuus]|uniref:Uncharacterized protein n=1 Tax=Helianthus annuus TaxID=4232 RepID=A0A251TPC5_HELAN|nr:hypothetical protein HanXRQr2_Chr10g0457451 [Helianthus annuus]